MYQFQFYMPAKVLFGAGQLNNLHNEKMPGKKALIVTSNGSSTKKFGYLKRVEDELEKANVEHILFDEVRANPTDKNVMDGAKKIRENNCDFVIALGGGSVMDAAKCIALMALNDGNIWEYISTVSGDKRNFEKPAIPLIAITTSAGTGSEVDQFSVISNDETKEKSGMMSVFPCLSIVDSDLMMSVPKKLTAYQGMDAFFHAAESVININEHPMGEMFALKAIELAAKYLPAAYQNGDDKEARAYMALANSLAGFYMLCTSQHRMEHVMGGYHNNLEHGAGLIMLSHAYFDFLAEKKSAEIPMIKMAKAMGFENPTSGKDFIKALDKLISDIDCDNLKMSDYGITKEELKKYPQRMHEVHGGDINADPIKLSDDDYLTIFETAYK